MFTSPQKFQNRFPNYIKGYQLHEILGKGGFGTVYRATVVNLKDVAIKLINKKAMKEANLTKRVANEVEIHWQLRHPSILELYNYFEDEDYVYLVMEFCEHGELYHFVKNRRLSEPETRGIMLQLINGLEYLHSNRIIHRDLKLSNLLLTGDYNLKIADFGLAVKLNDTFSEQKTMCGTPNYISPEIVSRLPYGLASDVWSVGCMMVTLLTGSPPFQSDHVKSTLDRVSKGEYILPDYISKEAKDLVSLLLQKDPKKRPLLSNLMEHPFFDPRLQISRLSDTTCILPKKEAKSILSKSITEPVNAKNPKLNNDPEERKLMSKEKKASNEELSTTQGRRSNFIPQKGTQF